MAKRFTETTKWEDDWFVGLSPKHKLLWIYLLDRCDHAGVWQVSMTVAGRFIGDTYDVEEALSAFGDRVKEFKPGYWFIPKFIAYQYGNGEKGRVREYAVKLLNHHGLDTNSLDTLSELLPNPIHTLKDKDKDKDKVKPNKGSSNHDSEFLIFWQNYPNKTGKGAAAKAWEKIDPPLNSVLKALEWQRRSRQWLKDGGDFIPHPTTYLNQKRWEDENPNQKQAPARVYKTLEEEYKDFTIKAKRQGWLIPTFQEWKKAKEEDK